jgi:hypothetical protein
LIVNVPRTNTYSLTRSVDAFIANDTYDAFKRVQHTVIAMRAEMKRLILALDIANPPGACIAAQAWRRLVEIEDQLVWMEARIPKSVVA